MRWRSNRHQQQKEILELLLRGLDHALQKRLLDKSVMISGEDLNRTMSMPPAQV